MSPERELVVGTRGSALALAQARWTRARLAELGQACRLEIVRTTGDADTTRPFVELGAPGLFVRELESALLEGRVDLAVHSYKDLPADSPEELVVMAVPEREDPRDRLLIRPEFHDESAGGLPLARSARVGTASARRRALVADLRPDLECGLLRGNVPTRLRKLLDGEHDAILLAAAGLQRLDRAAAAGEGEALERGELIELDLDPTSFVPAPSQGALALQVRRDDARTSELVARLDDAGAHRAVVAERELLALVEAGCQVPFGAWARGATELELFTALEVDGRLRRARVTGADPAALAHAACAALLPEREAR